MDHFIYKNGALYCENVPVSEVADAHGTPLYIYSRQTFIDHFDRIRSAFSRLETAICYSIKSCHNLAILRLLKERGSQFDVVSIGELNRAMEIGADPSGIVFAGVGKKDGEIKSALEAGIGLFNVESEQELEQIDRIAAELDRIAVCALRVNPDVDPKTHRYTTTGKRETKFGVDLDRARLVFQEFGRRKNIRLSGIHVHIGSPVNTIEPYVRSVTKVVELIVSLRAAGFAIETLNVGGGFGAHYRSDEAPAATEYADAIIPLLSDMNLSLILEPGRSISANAGILVGRTIYTKQSGDRQFLIVDASMTELIRPALYEAFHFAWPVQLQDGFEPTGRSPDLKMDGTILMDIVGPVCESGDFLAKDRWLPPVKRGDLIAIFSAGAYGSVMSSRYNSRPQAPEILVERETFRVIRRRETYNDMIAPERC